MTVSANDNQTASARRPTRVRHAVLWLTVAAYMITYMDRVVISTAAPSIQKVWFRLKPEFRIPLMMSSA